MAHYLVVSSSVGVAVRIQVHLLATVVQLYTSLISCRPALHLIMPVTYVVVIAIMFTTVGHLVVGSLRGIMCSFWNSPHATATNALSMTIPDSDP